jgi:hypothetical protein
VALPFVGAAVCRRGAPSSRLLHLLALAGGRSLTVAGVLAGLFQCVAGVVVDRHVMQRSRQYWHSRGVASPTRIRGGTRLWDIRDLAAPR